MRDHVRLQTAILLRRFAYEVGHAANSGSADAIHDLRVSIRRLNNCLRLFAPFYPRHSAKRIHRRLDGLMELGGSLRNLDVTLELLSQAGVSARSAIVVRLRDERRKTSQGLVREARLWKNRGFSRKWRGQLGL